METDTRSSSANRAIAVMIKVTSAIHNGTLEPSSGALHAHTTGGRIATPIMVPLRTAAESSEI